MYSLIWNRTSDRVPREELYWCMRDKVVPEKYIRSVKNMHHQSCKNKRTVCSGSWPAPRICFQPFPVCHHNRFTDEKHQKGSTLADDVCVCCGAVRKGEKRAGGGTGSVEETLERRYQETIHSTLVGMECHQEL